LTNVYLSDLLERVRKPARYLGKEINAIYKSVEEIKVHLVLAFPDLYEVGMSHLGLKILYALANKMPEVYAERVFAPGADMEKILRQENLPLFSLESNTPLHSFDLVGFSLQYELSYTAVLNMLELGGIPLYSADRNEADPLVLGGGPAVFNPEPLAPFFDFFVLGDGEEVLPEIIREYAFWKDKGRKREDFLEKITRIPGIYVPGLYEPVYSQGNFSGLKALKEGVPLRIEKRTVVDLEHAFYPDSFIVPYMEVVHDRAALELFRGCSRGCRFCQAGFTYRPVRERSLNKLKELAGAIIDKTGFEELSLSSLSSSDYPQIEKLIDELQAQFHQREVSLSLPSLRADSFALKLADKVQHNRTGGVTFAPEAGSQRLRNVINKQVSEEDILKAAARAIETGRSHIKLYFMIGLPTETEEDLWGIVELARKISRLRKVAKGRRRPFKIIISASTFIPKPHTPFQWEPLLDLERIKERQELLRQGLRKVKGVDFTWHEAKMSFLEAVFARGDRRLSTVLERAFKMGSRLDAWSDSFDFSFWEEAFRREGIDPGYYAYYHPHTSAPLPWDHISTGVSKQFLISERKKALEEKITGDCRESGCSGCGLNNCPVQKGEAGCTTIF
jgi:radical SAM family uncharacterized protein